MRSQAVSAELAEGGFVVRGRGASSAICCDIEQVYDCWWFMSGGTVCRVSGIDARVSNPLT
jgi:hypothetical protein